MAIFITLTLLLALALSARFLNKKPPFQICPICISVSGTWLLLTAAILLDYASKTDFLPIILLLLGGTVTGIAYQGEKSIGWAARYPFAWKLIIVTGGIPLAFWATENISVKILLVEMLALAALAYIFFIRSAPLNRRDQNQTRELEKKLKNCC